MKEDFIKKWICRHYNPNCLNSHCENVVVPEFCKDRIRDLHSLIQQECRKMLPLRYVPSIIDLGDREAGRQTGYNEAINITENNIDNYKLGVE